MRQQAPLSRKELARRLKASQQQVSRLESSGCEGHSLSMLRRVAKAPHARVRVVIEPEPVETELRPYEIPAAAAWFSNCPLLSITFCACPAIKAPNLDPIDSPR